VNVSPVLALAGLAAIGLLATRLPHPKWPHVASLDPVLAAGGPLVAAGLVLGGGGIGFLSPALLRALAPLTALALGWIGAALGARFEWRYARRIPRDVWLLAMTAASAAGVAVALLAALLARALPPLGAAWVPRLPSVLTLGAVAAASGPGAVTLVLQAAGIRERIAQSVFTLVAALQTTAGALLLTLPFALHRPHAGGAAGAGLGWLAWLVFALGSGVLVGMMFVSLSRLRPARTAVGWALLAAMLFGAGVGYAAELSPFVVCALAASLIVNVSPRRHLVRQLLADWERPLNALFLVVVGALLALPRSAAWIVPAAIVLAGARVAAAWGAVRVGRELLGLRAFPPNVGLATVAQGTAALAFGLNFAILYGGEGTLLTTVVLLVALAQLAAPRLFPFALPLPLPTPVPEGAR
jgi:hypothetical protein